ncbi:beta-1,3-galactosyltransferase brn [Zerene cesonia]|uniref:beta-1,3-galactosyltransferase brn n=1 Tax=Zerene cesonia TaxID=33412 RepID=UPI0018E598B3|nr:beta-1,3-galactosyltransferase brn [Zerene cesonia]
MKQTAMFKMRRKNIYRYCVCVCVLLYIYYFFGVSDYVFSKSFDNNFDYPLNIDIQPIVNDVLSGRKPSVTPINYYPYRFLTNSGKCSTIKQLDLFIIVKSAMGNFDHRSAIRQTFAKENAVRGKTVKTLFFLGIDDAPKSETQMKIDEEMAQFKDIIQIDFLDTYFNNTIKTVMSFRWLYEHCPMADYYLFTDDDMYISVKNLLSYVHGERDGMISEKERVLFAGYVFKSIPQRFRSSKWRVSLEEYPWDKWPPYVTAGAFVLSNKSMKMLYVASLFVKHFRFDDIYLGIVAKKVGIEPTHCANFHFYKKKYSKDGYKNVIASHGYDDKEELIRVWNEQN